MSKIILTRTTEFINAFRNYEIYIDGKKVGSVSNRETKELDISPGLHSIICKIDWCSSKEIKFIIKEGEIKSFKIGGFKNANWFLPIVIILIVLVYLVYGNIGLEYLFYLIVPLFLILLYYVTIGRKNYLNLSELKKEGGEVRI